MSKFSDSGMPASVLSEERRCLTTFMPIHMPAMRTNGMPIPRPTPRPTFSAVELELEEDGVGDEVLALVCEAALEVDVAGALVAEAVVDELVAWLVMLK